MISIDVNLISIDVNLIRVCTKTRTVPAPTYFTFSDGSSEEFRTSFEKTEAQTSSLC